MNIKQIIKEEIQAVLRVDESPRQLGYDREAQEYGALTEMIKQVDDMIAATQSRLNVTSVSGRRSGQSYPRLLANRRWQQAADQLNALRETLSQLRKGLGAL
jgi:hypothetical protein